MQCRIQINRTIHCALRNIDSLGACLANDISQRNVIRNKLQLFVLSSFCKQDDKRDQSLTNWSATTSHCQLHVVHVDVNLYWIANKRRLHPLTSSQTPSFDLTIADQLHVNTDIACDSRDERKVAFPANVSQEYRWYTQWWLWSNIHVGASTNCKFTHYGNSPL